MRGCHQKKEQKKDSTATIHNSNNCNSKDVASLSRDGQNKDLSNSNKRKKKRKNMANSTSESDSKLELESKSELKVESNKESQSSSVDIANMSTSEIRNYLNELSKHDDTKTLQAATEALFNLVLTTTETKSRNEYIALQREAIALTGEAISRLQGKLNKYISEPDRKSDIDLPLGSNMVSCGCGASAKDNREKVDAVVQSLNEEYQKDRKGSMLSHVFYRIFLETISERETTSTDNDPLFCWFLNAYERIWISTQYGIVSKKNMNGKTPEHCATSIFGALVNQVIARYDLFKDGISDEEERDKTSLLWTSEYELFNEKDNETNNINDSTGNKGNKGTTSESNIKGTRKPRSDGILVATDPMHEYAYRPLVSMEAKLSAFIDADRYESRSNVADAFALSPPNEIAWPCLMFRCVLGKAHETSIKVYAVVPYKDNAANTVLLWEGEGLTSVYQALISCVVTSELYLNALLQKNGSFQFCRVSDNVAIDYGEGFVFKSFYKSSNKCRHANLLLIQKYVDENATTTPLGRNGCFVTMKYLGSFVNTSTWTCNSLRFLEIIDVLKTMHAENICHGDIRLSNLILNGSKGYIIDFDFAGKAGERLYPAELNLIPDGERHLEVQQAIENETIHELPLKKAHDWHSLSAVMKCFNSQDPGDGDRWQKIIDYVERLEREDGISDENVLDVDIFEMTLVLKEDKRPNKFVTATAQMRQ